MDKTAELKKIGQSLWYDNILRDQIKDGTIQKLIDTRKISGITSNPSIFKKAILGSTIYRIPLRTMAWAGWTAAEIYEQLAVEDIRNAADLLLPVYTRTSGGDGYVSLEVDPELANDTKATAREALRLWEKVNRPNLMIKIPATKAGIPAIRSAIAVGINVNVTLIFSVQRYQEVVEAYLQGLEERERQGLPLKDIASVASFFVSRFDTKIDARLEKLNDKIAQELMGKSAVANARTAYRTYQTAFLTTRFLALKKKGARIQRPLWASTSTKNPAYSDVMYVEELIGPDTVNTVPPATLDAFFDHGKVEDKISSPFDEETVIEKLTAQGISLEEAAQELEQEGVSKFQAAFHEMLDSIETQREQYQKDLGTLEEPVKDRARSFNETKFTASVFRKDAALWTKSPEGQQEIEKRLSWLEAPRMGVAQISSIQKEVCKLLKENFKRVVLIGMGGSSLAAEVMSLIFGTQKSGLELRILDSTDPMQVAHTMKWAQEEKTVFLVSSKSGTTAEVKANFSYAWEQIKASGVEKTGDFFIAITDPGTALQNLAESHEFRAVFQADPNVGGRYSALTAFGLVPTALLGVSLPAFLKTAQSMRTACDPAVPAGRNPGLVLGTILGEAYLQGKDKLSVLTDTNWASFGSWVEQLIAESSGKEGKGILPIDKEPELPVNEYAPDHLFVYLRENGEKDDRIAELKKAGHPCLTLEVGQPYALAEQFYQWEFATATACSILGVNAFDQPNVQDSKTRTKQKVKAIEEKGQLVQEKPLAENNDFQLFSKQKMAVKTLELDKTVDQFLSGYKPVDYIAVNAFVERNEKNETILQAFRKKLAEKYKLAVTLGYGPRFLHSTGQLHKGGKNNGFFIVLSCEAEKDMPIPGQAVTFQQMLLAQTLGDIGALDAAQRRVVYIYFKEPNIDLLKKAIH